MSDGAWLLRCICDETRFEMLEMLISDRELCVGDFVRRMKRDQPLISHHVKRLRECGIITPRCEGKKTLYRISNARLLNLISGIAEAGRQMPNLCRGKECAC